MPGRTFYIVDVFAIGKYTGNQLGVVPAAGELSDEEMQTIARELNFAETTFLTGDGPRDGGFDVRIFTPMEEVPFAGHPTLGTAWVIGHQLLPEPPRELLLHLAVGSIPVRFEGDLLWMHQKPPSFGATVDARTMGRVLGLEADRFDAGFPIQAVSTGLPAWIVPLVDLAAVKAARLNVAHYEDLIRDEEAKNILIFSRETYEPENQLNARMFAQAFGVPEDPATGSANGCLAGYLVEYRFLGDEPIDIRVEQGYEIRRPSLLRLRAARQGAAIDVHVGGGVVPVARGEFL